ncbi:hypothetical protein BX666DRAFT_1927421 [Dichotomocladium elegans]|nr:hypothetical protein BX666DRAFT_1927421 [Dichotomocladium elegans]
MVSLGITSTLFTIWLGITAAAAATGTARQQHVQPQALDGKAILYIVGGMIGNTTLITSPNLPALQMDAVVAAAAQAAAAAPFFLPSDGMVVVGSRSAVRRQQLPNNDLSNTDDGIGTYSMYRHRATTPASHDQSNHTTISQLLYMVHGSDLWQLESPANKWTLLGEQVRGFAGPSTVMARSGSWLISCFAANECICFDTRTRTAVPAHSIVTRKDQKIPHGPTRMVLLSDRYALVHTAEKSAALSLGNRWLIDLANPPHLVWQQEDFTSALWTGLRIDAATRAFQPTFDSHLRPLVRRGPGNGTTANITTARPTGNEETESPASLFTTSLSTSIPSAAIATAPESGPTAGASEVLNGGTIAGIVVGIAAFLCIVSCLLVWKRRQRRSKLNYFQKQHHRSARFSLSTTPPTSRPVSAIHDHPFEAPGHLSVARTASLPEPARISTLSLDSDQQFSATIPSSSVPHISRLSRLHHDFSTSYSSVCVPGSRYDSRIARHSLKEAVQKQDQTVRQPEPLWMRPSPPPPPPPPLPSSGPAQIGLPKSALRRLTFNISSALRRPQSNNLSQDPVMAHSTPTSLLKRYTISGMVSDHRRTSGMLFGSPADPSPSRHFSTCGDYRLPRLSMSSARSVSSVQWVGFNDQMDYKEQHWDPSVQLAVTNHLNRHSVSSSRTTSVMAAAAMERSSNSPRQSTPSYRLSAQEVYSWEDMLYSQQSGLTLAGNHHHHPSATSLPALPYNRNNTPASLESILMDQSKISV